MLQEGFPSVSVPSIANNFNFRGEKQRRESHATLPLSDKVQEVTELPKGLKRVQKTS